MTNDVHYLKAIRIRLEQLYEEHPNNPALRERISDEVDWIDAKLLEGNMIGKAARHGHYYIVICKDRGVYVLATRRHFRSHSDAELYLASVAVSREPAIVLID